jgi:predicted pyridoxine 5'-phosphate oxidase superfamily flavin-nucleotide-binding protein
MGKVVECITPELQAFIEAQPLFFVASAPLAESGHVNVSPKGLDCLRVLAPDRVAYLDLTGSGNETAAHLGENGRVTFMFCAFTGPPRILRLYGTGEVALPGTAAWDALVDRFPAYPGARQIVVAAITRVQTSCGFAVPRMKYVQQRDTLLRWAEAKGEALPAYRAQKNATSIDGLPAPSV